MPVNHNVLEGRILNQVGVYLHDSVLDPINHQNFLQWFSSQQRVDAPYAVELFGNPNAVAIPRNSSIGINANDTRLWHGNEFVANGIKITVDDISKRVFKKIADAGLVRLQDLIGAFPEDLSRQVEEFVIDMIKQDVFSIYTPSQHSNRND